MPFVDWPPNIQYARTADVTDLGYAVMGEGQPDILFAIGMATSLGIDITEEPGVLRWHERLASMGRLLVYDQRGTGVSDPIAVNDLPTLERVAEDMEAVLDAAGSERAVIVAIAGLG